MKRLLFIILTILITLSFASCKGEEKSTEDTNDNETVSTVSEVTEDKIDYDISRLSTTMAYSQVSEMTTNSAKYLGKRVKIKGTFLVEETEQRNYYACHIKDATACCSIGFEFVLKDTSKIYPNDYPSVNDEITVEGIFHSYKEGENTYYELIDAVLL